MRKMNSFTPLPCDLKNKSRMHVPSKTQFWAEISSIDELTEACEFARQNSLKLKCIGNGTNILFAREHYSDTLFVRLTGNKQNVTPYGKEEIVLDASASLSGAGRTLTSSGYKDFLFMCLIPGSVGGAVYQNAGTIQDGAISDVVKKVNVFNLETVQEEWLSSEQLQLGYRSSVFQNRPELIILSAVFLLGKKQKPDDVCRAAQQRAEEKRNNEPNGFSLGSVFKQPVSGKPAWEYIDQAGLRGHRCGGAVFSPKHCNWIVNDADATSDDVLKLIQVAQQRVKEQFDIDLIPEIECI